MGFLIANPGSGRKGAAQAVEYELCFTSKEKPAPIHRFRLVLLPGQKQIMGQSHREARQTISALACLQLIKIVPCCIKRFEAQ